MTASFFRGREMASLLIALLMLLIVGVTLQLPDAAPPRPKKRLKLEKRHPHD